MAVNLADGRTVGTFLARRAPIFTIAFARAAFARALVVAHKSISSETIITVAALGADAHEN